MEKPNKLRRTEVHRNLEYRFTVFGVIDSFDAIVSGTLAMTTALVCSFMDHAPAWGIPVFVATCLAMMAIRVGSSPDDILIKIRAALTPRHLSILNRDENVEPFYLSIKRQKHG